jgi:hypothetical protein
VFLDVFDRVADGSNLFRVLVGDINFELLFERQHQLDDSKRISAQIFDELGLVLHFSNIDIKLLSDDFLDLLRDIHPTPPKGCNWY